MDYEFSSKEELYARVKPALHSKIHELEKDGYSFIKETDIWAYLSEAKWSRAKDLTLADIVSDILNVRAVEVEEFIKEKLKNERVQYFDNSSL